MIHIPELPRIYAIFIILSFIIPFLIIFIRNKNKYKKEVLFYSFLTAFICAMLGGVVYHGIASVPTHDQWEWGLSAYGGAIGLIASVFIYSKILSSEKTVNISDENKKNLREEFLMHVPLIYSISKIACGMGGCCYGFKYCGPFSITYNGTDSYLPIQFIETLFFFIIYLVGIIGLKKSKNKVLIIFALSAHCKAILECFRNGYSGININQGVSFVFIIVCLTIILLKEVKNNEENRPTQTPKDSGRLHV